MLIGALLFVALQTQAKMKLKHGIYLSHSISSTTADTSGKHHDFANFIGTNPEAITISNANIYDGKISKIHSFGYNMRYLQEVGFGYELGIYVTKVSIPKQDAALIHDDGSAFKQNTPQGPTNVVVDSPYSYQKTTDVYLGGLYNFAEIKPGYTPYVGIGYARVKGDWYNSYYRGTPGEDPRYGTEGKTNIDGDYISFKVGLNFKEHYNLELEYSKHKRHADVFRSLNINGSDTKFSQTSINLLYTF